MASAAIPSSQGGQHAAHGARGAHAARSGGKAAHGDVPDAQAPQDAFSALLASLGGGEGDDGSGLPAPDAVLPQTGDGSVQPGDASLAAALPMAGLLPGQAQAIAQAWNGTAGDKRLDGAQWGGASSAGAGLQGGGVAWNPLVPPGAQAPGSLVAQTSLIDKAADNELGLEPEPARPAGHAAAKPRSQGWSPSAKDAAAAGIAAAPGKAEAGDKKAAALPAAATAQASASVATGAERRDGTAGLELHRQAGGEAAALAAPGLQALAGMLGEARAEARQAARGGESAGAATGLHGTTATGEPAAEPTQAVPDGSGVQADPSQMAGDDALAEQVAFWVNQKTQNAELTLDRDGQPVEVRVSLAGNEAHVTFRSDQVQTRDALDASTTQLRDLLQREGLVLAGVTVGSSGAGGAGGTGDGGAGRELSGRRGAQQGRVQAAVQSGGAAAAQVSAGNRALDVFV